MGVNIMNVKNTIPNNILIPKITNPAPDPSKAQPWENTQIITRMANINDNINPLLTHSE